jgi:hypothetical protein
VRVDGQLTFNTTAQMLSAALSGYGLTYVPEGLVEPHVAQGPIEARAWKLVPAVFRLSHLVSEPPPILLGVRARGGGAAVSGVGSTSASKSASKVTSFSTVALRPPPARRTRPLSQSCPIESSSIPRPMVLGAIPVAAAAAAIPPYPADTASDAATKRRPRSSRNGATTSKRCRIKAVSITHLNYANVTILGNPQSVPRSIRLFSDESLGKKLTSRFTSLITMHMGGVD